MMCDALDGKAKTALDVETLVGGFLVLYEHVIVGLPPDAWALPGLAMVEQLEAMDSPRAATLLEGFSAIGAGVVGSAAAAAAARLAANGHVIEDEFAALGHARPTQAWVCPDLPEPEIVVVDFDYPGDRSHSVAVFVDTEGEGIVRQINLMLPMAADGREPWPDLEPVPLPTAGRLIHETLERSHPMFHDAPGLREYGAMVWARLPLLGSDLPQEDVYQPDPAQRAELVDAFLASPEGADHAADDVARAFITLAVDWACDAGFGRPMRWSPREVAEFMVTWLPANATHEVRAQAGRVLPDWVRFAARSIDGPEGRLLETLHAIQEWDAALASAADQLRHDG